MKSIIHISDLHFGKTTPAIVQSLANTIKLLNPDLLVVSGDLTQRARTKEFKQAHNFLQTFKCHKIVVPGNHDIPLFNIFGRFFNPLKRYQKWINEDLNPIYSDSDISVLGVNTAHSWTVAGGKMPSEGLHRIKKNWIETPSQGIKILVSHHPIVALTMPTPDKRWGYSSVLPEGPIIEASPDLLLSGHLHQTISSLTADVYKIPHRTMICVQAGTAISTRQRKETNAFNKIEVSKDVITIQKMLYDSNLGQFHKNSAQNFKLTSSGWISDTT